MGRRIAVLCLHPGGQSFIGAGGHALLAAALRRAGHAVVVAQSSPAGEPGGSDAWHQRLVSFVREGAFDIVALPRAWDEGIPAALRPALRPGASLVRLADGAPSPLDRCFDHVVDSEGLLTLADGAQPAAPAPWRPADARELKRASAPSSPEPAEAVVVIGPESGPDCGPPPTIGSGVEGCPYLADCTRNPHFAELDLDPRQVRTRGCSFCLDNTGAWVPAAPAATVRAWLDSLRALRRAQPDARRVLLVDERPHPHLPAFFRALADEPLAPVELLFKSRTDWILEFQDALAEAAREAARSRSVLHLYLIGFESFEPFHLELFNKGVTVADNVAALERVRELEQRFPDSFVFRRHRAHGFVAFTPWTTPGHVVENARWMRRLRFDEVRSEAWRTRLRLHPGMALHEKARREGLLAERFDDLRGDRAAEQGYNASTPWRFRDPRTEAVHAAAGVLASSGRLSDADALEIAAEFVLRWPGLGTEPALAHLPLAAALRFWQDAAALCAADGARAAAFDPEIEGVAAGSRRACYKELVSAAEASGLVRAYEALGLRARVVAHGRVDADGGRHGRGDSHAVVAVAGSDADLEEAAQAFAAQMQHADGDALRRAAALLGYPSCCADAFARARDHGDNGGLERQLFADAPDAVLHPLLHRLGRFKLLSHFPCRPDCAASVAQAEALLERVRERAPRAAALVEESLARPVLFLDYARSAELRGRWDESRFLVEHWDGGRREWAGLPDAEIRSIALVDGGVELQARDGRRVPHRAPGAFITSPGAPLPAPSLRALRQPPAETVAATPGRPRADAFLRAYLPGATLPLPLAGGLSIGRADVDASRGCLALTLIRDDAPMHDRGAPVIVDVERLQPGMQAFARTRRLAISHRALPDDVPARSAGEALRDLATRLGARDAVLDDAEADVFAPGDDAAARPRSV